MANLGEIQVMKHMAEKLKNKSDEELIEEIKKLKSVMASDDEKLKKQIETVRPFRAMLDEEQKHRFDVIIKALSE